MRPVRLLLALLVAALVLAGAGAPAQADAAKRKPTACAKAKAKAKKNPTAARKRAARRACRKPAKKRPPAAATPAPAPVAPAPAPVVPAPVPSAPSSSALQDGVVACANRERAARGIAPLAVDPALTRAAQGHAVDMAARGYFDHETPEGRTPWDRIDAALDGAAPFRSMGENIAMGYRTAESTCTGWMDSPGHRQNILNPGFTLIGAGWADGYAVQDFGDR